MMKSNFAIDRRWMRFNALKLASSFPIFAASCASIQQCFTNGASMAEWVRL